MKNKLNKHKKKELTLLFLLITLSFIVMLLFYWLLYLKNDDKKIVFKEEKVINYKIDDYKMLINNARKEFVKNNELKELKYIITFENGLIKNQMVMQTKDNLKYLDVNEKGEERFYGSLFFDYRNKLFNDKNTLIYGHHINEKYDPERKLALSSFDKLENPDFASKNQIFLLINEKEVRLFKIFLVADIFLEENELSDIYYPLSNEDYLQLNYDNDYLIKMINSLHTKKQIYFLDTNYDLKSDDKFITFQTCPATYDISKRKIVIAKEIK